jgi:3-deoxy-manno-octulosonate cytidylyltransferase (CMP-KDO synthetase)
LAAATVVIPARYGSTRFPAKILASQTGRPLVQHVVDQVRLCRRVRDVIVATDDERIVAALRPFGTNCRMTSAEHQSGTDRIAEVARTIDDEIIVNVQGDEPEIEPQIIDALIERLQTTKEDMATAATPFATGVDASAATDPAPDPTNPNLVKVVMGVDGRAIYFSRRLIPFDRDRNGDVNPSTNEDSPTYYLHLGIYAYRRPFLLEFAGWKPTPLERTEKLEQLRALEHGKSIGVLVVQRATHGIDTPEQYAEFVKRVGSGQ